MCEEFVGLFFDMIMTNSAWLVHTNIDSTRCYIDDYRCIFVEFPSATNTDPPAHGQSNVALEIPHWKFGKLAAVGPVEHKKAIWDFFVQLAMVVCQR